MTTTKRKPVKKQKYYAIKQLKKILTEDWQWAGKIERDNAEHIWDRKENEGVPYLFTINEALRLGLKQLKDNRNDK